MSKARRANVPGGLSAVVWLVIVAFPVYFMVVTSLRSQKEYVEAGALDAPTNLTFDNYLHLADLGFDRFILNSLAVTAATIGLVIVTALPAAYAIVRNTSRVIQVLFTSVLFGFAGPAQAVIIPILWLTTRLHLYDSLLAVVLPTAAFSIPLSIIVLTSTLREIPPSLYEAMSLDGAGTVRLFLRLVVPLGRPGLTTISIFAGLNAWNGFLFPLILTQDPDKRVISLGLSTFQGQYGTDVPGLMSAVLMSAFPVLVLYLLGRRHLVRGFTAGFSR